MGQFNSTIAIDNIHTVLQRALDWAPGFGENPQTPFYNLISSSEYMCIYCKINFQH